MAVQTFYHLHRMGFLDENTELLDKFLSGVRPRPDRAAEGIYVQSSAAPLLDVCGRRFHHKGMPAVPIVAIKMWPLGPRMQRYQEPMQKAQRQVQAILQS